jgi:vancomycin resistance protein VanJ
MPSVASHVRSRVASSVHSPSPIDRAVRAAAWLILAATAIVAILMWGFGDAWWPATFLLFVGRWIYLVPPLVLAPAVALLRPKLLGVLALDLLLVLGPVMGGQLGWRRLLPVPEGMRVRVVSFNAEGGLALAPMLTLLLTTWDADIVLLQECGVEMAEASERLVGWNWHHQDQLCLLTRYPILAAEPMDRTGFARLRRDERAHIGGAGNVVRYTLRSPRGSINVTNLHLETPRKGFEGLMLGNVAQLRENTALRDIESSLARRWVDAGSNPSIVGGDFNTTPESRIFQAHWSGLDDAFVRVGTGFGYSKYNGWIRVRIDHVLTNDAWRAVRVHTSSDLGSDHRPVIVDLVLRR